MPVAEEEVDKGQLGKLGVLPDFRVRILPVLGTMPAIFGYTVANYIICEIAGYPIDHRVGDRGREKMYEGILSALQGTEARLLKAVDGHDPLGLRIPLSTADVGYLVEEVFRGKSVVSGLTNRLALIRWKRPPAGFQAIARYEPDGQKSIKLGVGDLVLMTKEEAHWHEKEILKTDTAPEEVYEAGVVAIVEKRRQEELAFDVFR